MEYSCLATLAGKYSTSIGKIRRKYARGKEWTLNYKTTRGATREKRIVKLSDCRKTFECVDELPANRHTRPIKNSIRERLLAGKCELCGTAGNDLYEVHHVKNLKSLTGNTIWEQVMLARRRKTLIVCDECHTNIHAS